MAGNIRDWTTDRYASRHPAPPASTCYVSANPRGRAGGDELRRAPAADADAAQGSEGWIFAVAAAELDCESDWQGASHRDIGDPDRTARQPVLLAILAMALLRGVPASSRASPALVRRSAIWFRWTACNGLSA